MSELSKSPGRFTFQKDGYLQRKAEEGKTPENDEDVASMVDYYSSWAVQTAQKEAEPDWKENNMEYDLRSTEWILEKVRSSEVYAQNLYAAMCNNEFQKNEFMPLLAGKTWGCSWRYAGGIIADMRQEGDYIDWYCSGIRNNDDLDDESYNQLTKEQQEFYIKTKSYVAESVVTDEIRADLKQLGWEVIPYDPTKDY
jgi:hypothetical protein